MKKIIGFAGSTSSTSINKQLVSYAGSLFANVEVEILDLNNFEVPLYSADREKEGFPDLVHSFREKLHSADAIICSMAEHNKTYTAAFKNLLDWCSRVDMNVFDGKSIFLMSTSPGGYGGGNALAAAKDFFPKAGAEIVQTFSLPKFYDNFKDGKIINTELNQQLLSCVQAFEKS